MPVGVRPPWVNTSNPVAVRSPTRASMATTTHWAPNSSAISVTTSGRSTAAVFTPDLVGAGPQQPPGVLDAAHSAADRQGDEHLLGGAGHHVDDGVAGVGRRGDVEEHQLVRALGVVAGGQLDRVAGVAQFDEVDALDHPTGVDVEARDDPRHVHGRRPERLTAAATVNAPS